MKRIGVFGGSFDPIHFGHLIIADRAAEALKLDRVLFIPTAVTPHKRSAKMASNAHRLAMVRAAVRGNPRFEASDLEIRRGGVSYTIDTLHELRKRFSRARLHLIVGSDSLAWLPKWHRIRDIAKIAVFVVAGRPEHKIRRVPIKGIRMRALEAPLLEISSTDIRRRVKRKRSIRYLTPDGVVKRIQAKRLYRS